MVDLRDVEYIDSSGLGGSSSSITASGARSVS